VGYAPLGVNPISAKTVKIRRGNTEATITTY